MGEIGKRHHATHENGGNDEIDVNALDLPTYFKNLIVEHWTIRT